MRVVESAARLFDWLSVRDRTLTKHVAAGLSQDEIARILAPTGIQLPPEAHAFYSRFNLPSGYMYTKEQPQFYGHYRLLGLQDAVAEFTSRRTLWLEYFPEAEAPGSFGWFPFLQEDAYLYVLDTAHTANGRCPIIDLPPENERQPVFGSLEAMFDTLYHWGNEGLLGTERGGLKACFECAEGDVKQVVAIAKRCNPGIDYFDGLTDWIAPDVADTQSEDAPRAVSLLNHMQRQNRLAALNGMPVRSGYDRSQYPFASTVEGGAGAYVSYIPSNEERKAGYDLLRFYRDSDLSGGDKFTVTVDGKTYDSCH